MRAHHTPEHRIYMVWLFVPTSTGGETDSILTEEDGYNHAQPHMHSALFDQPKTLSTTTKKDERRKLNSQTNRDTPPDGTSRLSFLNVWFFLPLAFQWLLLPFLLRFRKNTVYAAFWSFI